MYICKYNSTIHRVLMCYTRCTIHHHYHHFHHFHQEQHHHQTTHLPAGDPEWQGLRGSGLRVTPPPPHLPAGDPEWQGAAEKYQLGHVPRCKNWGAGGQWLRYAWRV